MQFLFLELAPLVNDVQMILSVATGALSRSASWFLQFTNPELVDCLSGLYQVPFFPIASGHCAPPNDPGPATVDFLGA